MKLMKQAPSVIEALQANKIVQKLEKKKETGEIRGESEFQEEVSRQFVELRNNNFSSYYSQTEIPYDRAYSEYINTAFEDIILDLQVAFFEANNLYSKIVSHDIFFNKSVDEIEKLIKRAKASLSKALIEAGTDNAFSTV